MNITDYFQSTVDPNNISVYIGRVIKLDENFESNGILYVDLIDPNGTDLNKGAKTSEKACASYAVRTLYRCWTNPPEIKSKAQFDGSMSFTSSGDFHLRNYCFDMYTLTYLTQVSSILGILFPVMPTVPPPMISIDTTPFPGQAVAVNVSVSAKEVVNESIHSVLKDIEGGAGPSSPSIPSEDDIVAKYNSKNNRSRASSSVSNNDPVYKIVDSIVTPITGLLDVAVTPYYDFIKCISLLLEIYEKNLADISAITFPITQFSEINDDGTATIPAPMDVLSIKNSLQTKIDKFKDDIDAKIQSLKNGIAEGIIRIVYKPIANLYNMVDTKIQDIVTPIKNKIVELIGNFVKDPLSQLTGLIAMAIQPVVTSLPTIIQIVVKLALKKLLQLLLGVPIKLILKVVIDPIMALINKAIEKIEGFLGQIISTAINTLINPVISVIQKGIAALIPDFGMEALITKLESIKDGTPFPKIFIENDPVKPYKDFDEINWSDPSELKAMLLALISEVGPTRTRNRAVTNLNVKVSKEEIWKPSGQIQGAEQKAKVATIIYDSNGDPKTIAVGVPLEEGSLPESTGSELFYKKFSSKEEFMPFFEERHNPVMIEPIIGSDSPKTIFTNITPQVWITNGVAYIDVEDKGEKVRYICYYNRDGKTIGTKRVKCLVDGVEVEKELEDNKVYYSTTIPHIKKDDNDPPVGDDLVPVIENGSPKQVKIPKTVTSITGNRQLGDILYYEDVNTGNQSTFKEISDRYYRNTIDIVLGYDSLAENIKEIFNNSTGSLLNKFKQTDLYKSITGNPDYNFYFYRITKERKGEGEDQREIEVKEPVTLSSLTDSMITIQSSTELTITIRNPLSLPSILPGPMGMLMTIKFNMSDGKLTTNTEFSCKTLIQDETLVKWPEEDNTSLTCSKKTINNDQSADFYCWMTSSLIDKEVNLSSLQDQTAVQNQMTDMLVNTVQAIGQDGDFSADALFDANVRKVTSEFNKIADAVSGVDSVISSTLERVDELKQVGSLIDKIAEIGSKVKEVADTAGPALEATAKAASAVAIQSCSMSQSASGKDFSFNSGTNYDLSTTTTAKAQLPYCKELGREQFLEPNCKVIVLAIGAGKQNLYVVDILT